MSITKGGQPIQTVEEWGKQAGPKARNQWAEGRSAMELARAWISGIPDEVKSAFKSHPSFGEVKSWTAEPEVQLRFDDFKGEPSNSDLVVDASDENGEYLICVEGKADEPFDRLIKDKLSEAVERRLKNPRSNQLHRIDNLVRGFFHPLDSAEPPLKEIRYQLLTACAGMMAEAKRRNVGRTLLLVHEFQTDRTAREKLVNNARDLDRFIHRLSRGRMKSIETGQICGPFELPEGSGFATAALFVGKITRDLRT